MIVDLIVIAILVGALAAGLVRGLFASIGTLVGFAAGAVAAFWLAPVVTAIVPSSSWRGFAVLVVSIVVVGVGIALGSALGALVRRGVDRTPLRWLERLLGGVASVIVAALAVSVAGAGVAATGIPGVSSSVASSKALAMIDDLVPEPVQATLAELRGAVIGDGLPQLDGILGRSPVVPEDPVDLADPQLQTAAQSVARISGVAYACGRTVTGTGFVVAHNRVLTNAHVVAGVKRPVVELPGDGAHEGRVVAFDPERDVALIAVDVDAEPLQLAPTLKPGSAAAVEGYPYGGPLTAVDAGVLSVGAAPVDDIYGDTTVTRELYSLDAVVKPGNSGGPLLTPDGEVAGLVFARDENRSDRGYAMTSAEYGSIVAKASSLTRAVATGACTE